MKSEQEIRERIEHYEERVEDEISGSPDWARAIAYRNALQWVLSDD